MWHSVNIRKKRIGKKDVHPLVGLLDVGEIDFLIFADEKGE